MNRKNEELIGMVKQNLASHGGVKAELGQVVALLKNRNSDQP